MVVIFFGECRIRDDKLGGIVCFEWQLWLFAVFYDGGMLDVFPSIGSLDAIVIRRFSEGGGSCDGAV